MSSTIVQVKGIDAKAVHALLASPSAAEVVLVDVRTPGEQEVSRLPGKAASAGEGCLTGPGPFVITKEDFDRVKADYKDRQIITYWWVRMSVRDTCCLG
jgi:rhodanese-related sulfurtransferase